MNASSRVATAIDVAVIAITKLGISAIVWAVGIRAVSDDDFARVVLAQKWVTDPRFDPTGSSWLPFPFWLNGSVMALLGRSLDTARGVAWALGVASALLVYAAARLLVRRRRDAYLGALVATAIPYGAVLGVATVPELPTAALCVFAVATATSARTNVRLWGAAALLLACLSRYEPWLIAVAFATVTANDIRLRRLTTPTRRDLLRGWAAVALCLVAPVGWIVHNAWAHGDPLHFLGRVSAYRQALTAAAGDPWGGAGGHALAYPLALFRVEPELGLLLCCIAVARGVTWLRTRSHDADRAAPSSSPGRRELAGASALRVVALLGVMLFGLCAAAAVGGSPTHHAGRPLVAIWLVGGVVAGAQLSAWARAASRRRAVVGGVLIAALLAVGFGLIRPRIASAEPFADRADEITIGEAVRRTVPTTDRVLLEVIDYGYFAVMAASGRPEIFALDRSVDPRLAGQRTSFASAEQLRARLHAVGAQYWVATSSSASRTLGRRQAAAGRLGLWRRRSPAH